MLISRRLLLFATICLISHQVSADAESESEKEDASKDNINSSEEKTNSQEDKSDNKEESGGKDKEEREERREDYWNPPPFEDLYCGHMNCYDLLGVTRDSEKSEITRAYRKLALKWHPDKFIKPEEKKEAEKMFMRIAAGYEVLKDEESRKDYDYMMDHPEETYGNYYRYYKRRLAPKIDVRLVVLTLVTVMSMVQYYSAWYNHAETIKYLATVPRYRIQALDIAKVRGLLVTEKKGVAKEVIRKREEAAIKEIIEELMDQNGGYPKPELNQILWIQIIRFPRTLYEFVTFHLDWVWRFYILRHEYSDTEKEYIVRRRLGMTERQWSSLEAAAKRLYMDRRLWEAEAWAEWEEEREEEERRRRAESGRSKQERRWEKRGDNRMTFDENYEWDD